MVGLQTIQGLAAMLFLPPFLAIILILSPAFIGTIVQSPWTAHRPEAIQPRQWAGLLHLSEPQPVLALIAKAFDSY